MIVRLITPVPNKMDTESDVSTPLVIAYDSRTKQIVLRNIEENVEGANKEKNPELYGQLWDYTVVKSNAVFKNLYTNTYLSCQSGTSSGVQLTLHESSNKYAQWALDKKENLPGDDEGAPQSYVIGASSNLDQVISPKQTQDDYALEYTPIIMDHRLKDTLILRQCWFIEEDRIVVNNSTNKAVIIVPSNNTNEIIEAWDNMLGGNLLGQILPQDENMTVDASYKTFYLSSKRKGNSGNNDNEQQVNESENEINQIVNIVDGVPVTVQFYYGDPKQGASVTISSVL